MTGIQHAPGQKVRILVLFGSALVFGAERGNVEALRALRDHGAEILCLIRDEDWSTQVPPFLDAHGLPWLKIPYIHVERGTAFWSSLLRQPARFIRGNIAFLRVIRAFRPTHIHAYAQSFVANFAPILACVRSTMVYRAGDVPVLHNWFWRLTWWIVRIRADTVVANSAYVARSLIAARLNPDIVRVIYNAPPTRFADSKQQTNWLVPLDAQVVAYIGQIAEHKGPHVLIEAFERIAKRYPRLFLVLAGGPDWSGDAWGRALRQRVQTNPLSRNRIIFIGHTENVPELLARSEFLVVPSLFDDPSPNVVIEAKRAGRPVIGFSSGGIPELVEHGIEGFLCDASTTGDLEKALDLYLSNRELMTAHGIASRRSLERLEVSQFGLKWTHAYGTRKDGNPADDLIANVCLR